MDWTPVISAVGSVTSAILVYLARKDVRQLHIAVNSRLTELLKTTGDAQKAEGVREERARRQQS